MIPSDVKAEQTHHQFARDLVSQFTSAFETVPPQVSFALDAIQRHQCPETLQSFYSSFIAALEAKLRKKALSHIEINGLVKGNSDDRMCLNQILAEVVNIKQQEEDRPEHEENTTLNADQQDSTQNITSTSSNSQRHVVIPPLKLNLDDSDYHPTDIHQKDNFIALSDQKPLHDKFEEDCDVRLSLSSEDAVKDPIQGSKVTENSPPLSDLGPASHLPSKVMMFEQSNSDRPHHDTRHTKLRHSVAEAPSQIIRKHQTSYNPQRSSFGGKSNLAKGTAPSIVSSDGWTISTVPSGYNTFPFAVADGGMHNEQFGSTFSSSSKLHRTTTEQMIRLNAVNEERRRMTELMKKEMLLLSKLRRKVKGQVEDKLDQDSFVSLLDELEGMIEQQILFEENLGQSTDENEILRLSKQESRGEVTDAGGSEKENDGNRPEQKVGHKPNNMNPRRTEPVTRSDNRHDEDEVVIEDGDEEGADEHEEIVKTEDPTLNEPTNQTESPKPLSDRVHLEAKKEQPLKQPQQQHAQNDTNSTSKDKHNRQEKAREHPKEHGTRNRRRSPAPLVSQAEEVHDPIPISTSSRSRQESFSLPLNHSLPDQTTPSYFKPMLLHSFIPVNQSFAHPGQMAGRRDRNYCCHCSRPSDHKTHSSYSPRHSHRHSHHSHSPRRPHSKRHSSKSPSPERMKSQSPRIKRARTSSANRKSQDRIPTRLSANRMSRQNVRKNRSKSRSKSRSNERMKQPHRGDVNRRSQSPATKGARQSLSRGRVRQNR